MFCFNKSKWKRFKLEEVVFQPKEKINSKEKNYRIVGLEHIETDLIKLKSLMSMKTHVPFPYIFSQ